MMGKLLSNHVGTMIGVWAYNGRVKKTHSIFVKINRRAAGFKLSIFSSIALKSREALTMLEEA